MASPLLQTQRPPAKARLNWLPFTQWLLHYKRADLSGDLTAGLIVTVMLVPQSMAYALLAGLPPQVGLYASIAPVMIYGLLGTSRALSVGPVAIDSLLVAAGISALNPQSPQAAMAMALILALQIGVIQMLMGALRAGFVVNFLSHPVLSGFISGAAVVIGFSQLKHLLGLPMPALDAFYDQFFYAITHLHQLNFPALSLGLGSIGVLLFFRYRLKALLCGLGLPEAWVMPLTKTGPLLVVALGTLAVWALSLHESARVAIVGAVPAGLPPLTVPLFDMELWRGLFPTALTIALVGFMEAVSVAKSLASKKREKIDANQELIALGAANMGAAFSSGYPVTGGLSRSVVNFNAGANTGLASIITAGLMALTVLFLTPLFFYLPNAVLAAIIIVAVASLLDFKTFRHTWAYSKSDALSMMVTFFGVLFLGVQEGVLIGVACAIGLYLWRTSRPHIAIVGRVGDTEHFRNVLRHQVYTEKHILTLRVDESLYFPNAQYLEDVILGLAADNPDLEHLVLVCSAVNYIDASALAVLENLKTRLDEAGIGFYLAEVKGPVMDRLKAIGFVERIGAERIFISTHQAMQTLTNQKKQP